MRYVMQQRLFSITDSFTIKDESGAEAYRVRAKLLSIGKQLTFNDLNGNEVAFIRKKLITLSPAFEIYRNGAHVATVQKKLFSILRHRFVVDVPGPDDLEASGDFLDHEFSFERSGRTVARVSKKWFTFRDTYGVDIAEGEDEVLILASAVVIDMVAHEDDD